ncbi:unnamed protein product [Cutaneotrichosporon oleaginosum]
MFALLLLAPLALAQATFPTECYGACLSFSSAYANCIPNLSNEKDWVECLKPLCPGGALHSDAQKCITCVGDANGQDAWAGVEEACKGLGAGWDLNSVVPSSSASASAASAAVASASAPAGGANSGASAVSAPFYAVAGLAAAAIVL